jgi:hypothetical protein
MIYIIILVFVLVLLIIYYLVENKTININKLTKESFFGCPNGCRCGRYLRHMGKYRFTDDDL